MRSSATSSPSVCSAFHGHNGGNGHMRFAVAEEAAALRDASDVLLRARVTAALIRSAWASEPATGVPGVAQRAGTNAPDLTGVRDVWRGLADIGLTGTLVA